MRQEYEKIQVYLRISIIVIKFGKLKARYTHPQTIPRLQPPRKALTL